MKQRRRQGTWETQRDCDGTSRNTRTRTRMQTPYLFGLALCNQHLSRIRRIERFDLFLAAFVLLLLAVRGRARRRLLLLRVAGTWRGEEGTGGVGEREWVQLVD